VGRYGPLGRFSLRRTGRTNEAGEDTYARIVPTPIRILRADPFAPLVLALEQFDDQDQTATAAAILTRRVVVPTPEVLGVETPADAIAVSLDRTGHIDLDLIAGLLGMPPAEARAALGGAVFTDPATGGLVHAPEYLSGDVRTKLEAATVKAKDDLAFTVNMEALRAVLPDDLGPGEINAQLGAVWISAQVHRQFLSELLHAPDVRVENPLPGMWEVRGGRAGIRATSEWGTQRRPAPDIAQAVMEQKSLLVYDEVEDAEGRKRRVLNPVETTAAQEKAQALAERFAEWVWEDPERAQRLVDEYNRRFNSIVLRDYTDAGDYLTLPGLAASFTPLPHQRAAVARMIAEPAAGLFHEVGAGKTAEMVMGAMELRRIGLITKPVVVVPNHMLEQFTREWLHLYPQARILAASSKLPTVAWINQPTPEALIQSA
jgi:N12 class adenine-specific DNA methylase